MANSSNKNATKSLVMLIVTGVVLVAVTLCWFIVTKKTTVDSIGSAVNNDTSSTAKLYKGLDYNNAVAIKRGTDNNPGVIYKYEEITDESIKLENIIPGAEYFYKAVFTNCNSDHVLSLILTKVIKAETNGLDADKLKVYKEITNANDSVKFADADETGTTLTEGDFAIYKNKPIKDKITNGQTLVVYFSFKFADDVTVDEYTNKTINIESVVASLSSGEVAEETTVEQTTAEETSSETNNENS